MLTWPQIAVSNSNTRSAETTAGAREVAAPAGARAIGVNATHGVANEIALGQEAQIVAGQVE